MILQSSENTFYASAIFNRFAGHEPERKLPAGTADGDKVQAQDHFPKTSPLFLLLLSREMGAAPIPTAFMHETQGAHTSMLIVFLHSIACFCSAVSALFCELTPAIVLPRGDLL